MTTDHGSKVNILLVVTTVASVLINIGQFVNSWELRKFKEKYEVFEKKDKAFRDLSEETASRMADYRKSVEAAVSKVRGLIEEMDEEYELNVIQLQDEQRSLAEQLRGMKDYIRQKQQNYRDTFDKSYEVATHEELSSSVGTPFTDRVLILLKLRFIESRNSGQDAIFHKLFQFVQAVDKERLKLSIGNQASASVRSSPKKEEDNLIVGLAPHTECYLTDILRDGSWMKVKGKLNEAFEGWVYSPLVSIPPSHFLAPVPFSFTGSDTVRTLSSKIRG